MTATWKSTMNLIRVGDEFTLATYDTQSKWELVATFRRRADDLTDGQYPIVLEVIKSNIVLTGIPYTFNTEPQWFRERNMECEFDADAHRARAGGAA